MNNFPKQTILGNTTIEYNSCENCDSRFEIQAV